MGDGRTRAGKLVELEDRVETLEIKNGKIERELCQLTYKFLQFFHKNDKGQCNQDQNEDKNETIRNQLVICDTDIIGGSFKNLQEMDLFSDQEVINKYKLDFDTPRSCPSKSSSGGSSSGTSRKLDEEFFSFSETDDDCDGKLDLDGVLNGFINQNNEENRVKSKDKAKNDGKLGLDGVLNGFNDEENQIKTQDKVVKDDDGVLNGFITGENQIKAKKAQNNDDYYGKIELDGVIQGFIQGEKNQIKSKDKDKDKVDNDDGVLNGFINEENQIKTQDKAKNDGKLDLDGVLNGFINETEEEKQIKGQSKAKNAGEIDEKSGYLFEKNGEGKESRRNSAGDDSDLTEKIELYSDEYNYQEKSSTSSAFKVSYKETDEKVAGNSEISAGSDSDQKYSRRINNKNKRSRSPSGRLSLDKVEKNKILKICDEFKNNSISSTSTTNNDKNESNNKSITSSTSTTSTNKKKKNICLECGGNFARPSALKEHVRIHRAERPFKCTICSMSFKQLRVLKGHLLFHQKKGHKCSNCETICTTQEEFVQHISRDHPDLVLYNCSKCEKKYTNWDSYSRHRKGHSGVKYDCPICHQKFTRKDSADLHLKNVHDKNQNVHQQEALDSLYSGTSSTKNDDNIVGEDSKRVHQDKNNENNDTSEDSSSEEPEEESLPCPVCEEKFPDRKSLSKHSQESHIKIKYKCKFCTKSFTEKSKIEKHIAKHKKEKLEAESSSKKIKIIPPVENKVVDFEDLPIFNCPICPSTFGRKKELRKHSRIHSQMFL